MEARLSLKPMSANRMFWKNGKHTCKTADYLYFQNEVRDQMMGIEWPFGDSFVAFKVHVGYSNASSDLDNAIKPLLDTYQSIFPEFNDNKVFKIELYKQVVPKCDEYLNVFIRELHIDKNGEQMS